MAMSTPSPREQMIFAAMSLFQREGYAAASWRRLVQESGAPWGSAYHYFPNGKEQLGVAAIECAARNFAALVARCFPEGGRAADGIHKLFAGTGAQLAKSGFMAGCPISTVALETVPQSRALSQACKEAFELWQQTLADGLKRGGVAPESADALALTTLAAFEGALIQARVAQSHEPLAQCALTIAHLFPE
jgi:TetR/AcrR family transcriptional regulator, lmrAB and yxaGH operons repressor